MGGAMVCGRVQDANGNAHLPPQQELQIQRINYGRPPLANNNNNNRPPFINTNVNNNNNNIRISTPHQKIRVASIDYTPVGPEKDKFPFYCPLCLYYFSETIMETSCCKNYVCHDCAVHFLKGKEGLPKNITVVPKKLPAALRCPHCNTENLNLTYVQKGTTVRSYTTSPSTQARIEALQNGLSLVKQPETNSPENNKLGEDSTSKNSVNVENNNERSEENSSNNKGNDNFEVVNLDDSVGLPGVLASNNGRLSKTPRQQERRNVTNSTEETENEGQILVENNNNSNDVTTNAIVTSN
jgi:hypothetical protein